MDLDIIYNEDCITTMNKLDKNSIDLIITSPPYNMTKRKGGYADKENRYDVYQDWKTEQEYLDWSDNIFNHYDKVLKENGVILYNFSYSIENPSLPYTLANSIISNTNFMIADTIIWKKSHAIPHPASYNRLNRIIEFVWVFCRKDELKSFNMHKEITSTSKKGQNYYEIIDNFIEAKNNDGSTDINKATFSSDLITKLIKWYGKDGDVIYDNFMGTGTTALAAKMMNCHYIGSELSEKQCKFSDKRVSDYLNGN